MIDNFEKQNVVEGTYTDTANYSQPVQEAADVYVVAPVDNTPSIANRVVKGGLTALCTIAAWEIVKRGVNKLANSFKKTNTHDADDNNTNQ